LSQKDKPLTSNELPQGGPPIDIMSESTGEDAPQTGTNIVATIIVGDAAVRVLEKTRRL
jgi:hypothetical protein